MKLAKPFLKIALKAQKHLPLIMTGAGIVLSGTGTILACRQTTKLPKVIDEKAEEKRVLEETHEKGESSDAVYRKDSFKYTVGYAGEIVGLYALPVVLIAGGYVLIGGGCAIQAKRIVAVTAAYESVRSAFDGYRKRVIESEGKDADVRYLTGSTPTKVTIVDDETGRKEIVKAAVRGKDVSEYAKFFDEACRPFTKDPSANLAFLRGVEECCNATLHSKGHLFLNEVYDMLDLPRTTPGSVVGWVEGNGDNYVDFGLYELWNSDFVNSRERAILLDFNVDGVIFDKI